MIEHDAFMGWLTQTIDKINVFIANFLGTRRLIGGNVMKLLANNLHSGELTYPTLGKGTPFSKALGRNIFVPWREVMHVWGDIKWCNNLGESVPSLCKLLRVEMNVLIGPLVKSLDWIIAFYLIPPNVLLTAFAWSHKNWRNHQVHVDLGQGILAIV